MVIREAKLSDVKELAKVHVDSWRSTYKNIISDYILDRLSYRKREQLWLKALMEQDAKDIILVVENDSGQVIGFVSAGPESTKNEKYQCEIYAIYLLQNYQRKGIGKRLFKEAVHKLIEKNMTSMLLWVLKDNISAIHFYEKLGGKQIKQHQMKMGDNLYDEFAYGWLDITKIMGVMREGD